MYFFFMIQAESVFAPPEQGSMNGLLGEETSIEESVLHELEMVMTQVNLDLESRIKRML